TFSVTNAHITTPGTTGPNIYGSRQATPSISANGASNVSSAIIWTLNSSGGSELIADPGTGFASTHLFTGTGTNATSGSIQSFGTPMVADGEVFVGTSGNLNVFGLKLKSLVVTPNPASTTVAGTVQFTATGTLQDNTTVDLTNNVTWVSATTSVATIDGSGLATGVANGTSNITATYGGVPPAADTLTVGTLPTVTNVNPKGGPTAGGNQVIITGTNFTGATSVSFDGNT